MTNDLDKNITVFGRVLTGMAHFHQLARTPKGDSEFNPITDLQVLERSLITLITIKLIR